MLDIDLDRLPNDGLSEKDREEVAAIIKECLMIHYQSSNRVEAAYLDHWERLNAGEPSAENGSDEWSQTIRWALTKCEYLFDDWYSMPSLFPTITIY